MNVYVESNFVLEMALRQRQHAECEGIARLAAERRIGLAIPAFCLVEPYYTLVGRHRDRTELQVRLSKELQQLARTELFRERASAAEDVLALLARSQEDEIRRLQETADRVLDHADLLPLDADTLLVAMGCQVALNLSPPDAIVYASVLRDLQAKRPESACFLTRDADDFNTPDIETLLAGYGCKLLFNFGDGLGYIKSRLST